MKIIVDVNVVLSALIRDSATRKIILRSGSSMYFPEPSIHKIRKYQDYILKKSGLEEKDYVHILATLFKHIRIIPSEDIERNWNRAKKIMEHIDKEDVVFVSAALSLSDSVIWSDDRHFEKQDKVKVFKTKDLLNYF